MVSYAQTGGWNTCFMIIYLRNLPLVNVPDSPFIGERPLDLLLIESFMRASLTP